MAKKKENKPVLSMEEMFNNIDNAEYENAQIRILINELLELNKDNTALLEYIALSKKLEDNVETVGTGKKELFDLMEARQVDYLEGVAVTITLKKSYNKSVFDKDKFIADYGEETYNKYLVEKLTKGNCIVKVNDSVTLSETTIARILGTEPDEPVETEPRETDNEVIEMFEEVKEENEKKEN